MVAPAIADIRNSMCRSQPKNPTWGLGMGQVYRYILHSFFFYVHNNIYFYTSKIYAILFMSAVKTVDAT